MSRSNISKHVAKRPQYCIFNVKLLKVRIILQKYRLESVLQIQRAVSVILFQKKIRPRLKSVKTFRNRGQLIYCFSDYDCGYNISVTKSPLMLRSPNWPRRYPNDIFCNWHLKAETNGCKIQIEFNTIELEASYDFLKVI